MVGPNGLEPSTSSVSGRRSNQLSYGPTCERLVSILTGGRRFRQRWSARRFLVAEQLRNALECELGPSQAIIMTRNHGPELWYKTQSS
jgi:hypothetical protein